MKHQINLTKAQRSTIKRLDSEGWRLTIRYVYLDGGAIIDAHHFETFEKKRWSLTASGGAIPC